MELKKLSFIEAKRIYHYHDNSILKFRHVTHFLNSESTHRLKTKDNILYIVPKDNIKCIEIHAEDFTL